MITQDRLKELLDYDPQTGHFTHKASRGRVKVGDKANNVSVYGYVRIRLDGALYFAHRLAWLYVHGEFPPNIMDHINRVRSDNRICNLRLATHAENRQNEGIRSRNTSGVKGVSWDKRRKKWHAMIMIQRKGIHLGYHHDINSARRAYLSAAMTMHPFSPESTQKRTQA